MATKGGPLFEVTASAYRHGVIDKGMALLGDVIDGVMKETGCEIGDLVNRMDEASEKTVMLMDRLLAYSAPVIRIAASDRLMAIVSRLLDIALVRRLSMAMMTKMLAKTVTA